MSVAYEWIVEEMDGEDIRDTNAYDSLDEALELAEWMAESGCECRIALRKDTWDKIEDDLMDRSYAYTRNGQIFTDGGRFPKRKLKQLAKVGYSFWVSLDELDGMMEVQA